MADVLGLDDALAEADLVVTGEGMLGEAAFAEKVVGGIAGDSGCGRRER